MSDEFTDLFTTEEFKDILKIKIKEQNLKTISEVEEVLIREGNEWVYQKVISGHKGIQTQLEDYMEKEMKESPLTIQAKKPRIIPERTSPDPAVANNDFPLLII